MTRLSGLLALPLLLASLAVARPDDATTPEATPDAPRSADGAGRAVLVTGASSGIGRRTAELLAERGFHVYAGARRAEDLAALDALENVTAVRLDVTRQEEIDAAVALVRAEGRGLWGLVNNAGVAVVAPLIEVSEEDLDFQLEVNVVGPWRVTKAFAPLIIESRGRITTTGSISGFVTSTFSGPYSMSKFAVEAFTDALADEMAPFGVQVSVIDPGTYRSNIEIALRRRLEEQGASFEESRYRAQMERLLSRPADRSQFEEPDDVAEAFAHALTDGHPKRRYMVVPNQEQAEVTIRAAIGRVVQMNRDQRFAYDRAELIEMLDAALEAAKD